MNYREAYNIFASNGILFNHESPLRGETFVTRKITMAVAKIANGLQECLYIGNIDARRDWGHAKDYVEGMWRILNHTKPDDFVLATNRTTSVRDFLKMAFHFADINIEFIGNGINETGVCTKTNKTIVKIDPNYFRPTEVDLLVGNPEKAKKELNWSAKIEVEELCKEMVYADLKRVLDDNNNYNKNTKKIEEISHFDGGFLSWHENNINKDLRI